VKSARILIVDDDPSIRKFVRANLEARGYMVTTAEDGNAALHVCDKEVPDLIILDIIMPEMDGFEVCRRVRKNSPIPIIMLSAREGEMDKQMCLECGADEYLTKPFSLRELLSTVERILTRGPSNRSVLVELKQDNNSENISIQ
jgi:DNA-binding response OmpR family regulator